MVWSVGFSVPLGISTTYPEKGKEGNNPKRQVLVAADTAALTQGSVFPLPVSLSGG